MPRPCKHCACRVVLEKRHAKIAQRALASQFDERIQREAERIQGQGGSGVARRKFFGNEATREGAEPASAKSFGPFQGCEPDLGKSRAGLGGRCAGRLLLPERGPQVVGSEIACGFTDQFEFVAEFEVNHGSAGPLEVSMKWSIRNFMDASGDWLRGREG